MWIIRTLCLHDCKGIFELMYALRHLGYSSVKMLGCGEYEAIEAAVRSYTERGETSWAKNIPSALSGSETAYRKVSVSGRSEQSTNSRTIWTKSSAPSALNRVAR